MSCMIKKLITAMALLLLLVLIVLACDSETDISYNGQTITKGVDVEWPHREMIQLYQLMRRNEGVAIRLVPFGEDIEANRITAATKFLAGDAPTIIDGNFVDFTNPHFFSDLLPLMYANPNFDENEWFMNAFYGLAGDVGLFAFPGAFSYINVVVNKTIPELIEVMYGRETITFIEMLELHERFNDPSNPMFLAPELDIYFVLTRMFNDFFNQATGKVDFRNPEFINFLERVRSLSNPNSTFGNCPVHSFEHACRASELLVNQNYFFRLVPALPLQYLSLFDEQTLFTNPMFLVNAKGELLICWPPRPWAISSASTAAEQALALDLRLFIHGLDNVDCNCRNSVDCKRRSIWQRGEYTPTFQHINRNLMSIMGSPIIAFIRNHYIRQQSWRLSVSEGVAIDIILNRTMLAGEMPMAQVFNGSWAIREVLKEELYHFHIGLVTAEQTAQSLQNKVTLILMELE